jgi:hypothetical protein
MRLSRPLATLALAAGLAGCAATPPAGPGGGHEQLRLSVAPALRRAGVSDACIAQLDLATLAQVKGIANDTPRSSREVLQQRQRLRTAARGACGEI